MRAKFLLIFLISTAIVSCSDLKQVQKSENLDYKIEKAIEYYNNDECFNSGVVLGEMIDLVRGTQRSEKVYYYYAQSQYCQGDYHMANYYYENFVRTYPQSQFSEECLFMSAMCDYNLSPRYTLDQQDTRAAIDEFQLFLNRYPYTELKDSCNTMIAELRAKLEKKDYTIAKNYARTGKHKAAVLSLERAMNEYPDSEYKEEMLYLRVKSGYLLALNSVEEKKMKRFDETIESCSKFVRLYPESKWGKDVEEHLAKCIEEKENLNELNRSDEL